MRCSSFFISVYPIVLLGLLGCNSATEQSAATEAVERSARPLDSVAAPRATPPADQGQPVALAGRTFRLKSLPVNPTASEQPPKFNIYLHPSQLRDSVLVAQDTAPAELDRDRGPKLGVPPTAVSLFQTYYAGAGHYYYAVAERNQLRVYRKLLEEASPENEHSPLPQWQLFKTFSFFTTGVQQQEDTP